MRLPTCDSWGCWFILPGVAAFILTTGANLKNNSHPIRRVWSFNYYILNWMLDTVNLVYFITVLFYFHLSQLLITIELFDNCLFRSLVDLHCCDCFTFWVTSIHVETILNTHHFITYCVYLHIGIDNNWL